MSRPTEEELRLAMLVTRPGADIGPNVACVLKLEVLALQAELSETQAHLRTALDAGEAAELRIVELRAESASAVKPLLRAQIKELEAENAKLRVEVEALSKVIADVNDAFLCVEALPAKWQAETDGLWVESDEYVYKRDCADQVRAALRGES